MKTLGEVLEITEKTDREDKCRKIYRYLVSRFIEEKTGLRKIDEKLKNQEKPPIPVPWEEMEEFQRQDYLDMEYFYLRNPVHTESLDEEAMEALEELLENNSGEAAARAGRVVEETYKKVLAFSDEAVGQVQLFPSLAGEGIVPADALVLVLAAVPDYDEQGNLKDRQQEESRLRLLVSLKNQLEPILARRMDMPVRILIQEL